MSDTVSKSEFAALIGVTPGRVSQYLKQGRISAAAVEGEGRSARIRVEQAKADLRISLDVGQRFGNGLTTRLDASPARPSTQRAELPLVSGIDQEIKEQKLEQIRRANRKAAIADAMARGQLMKTEDAKAEMTRIGLNMLAEMEGQLPAIASAMSAEYKLPQRDVLHLLRSKFREIRAVRSQQIRAIAETLPEFVEVEIQESPETLN